MNPNPTHHQSSRSFTDHPLACIFPMMPEADLAGLAEDIQIHGQRAPITLLDSQILDGRNRYRACMRAGVEPITREFRGDDPLRFVLSANLHRRHLSESQRAMVAAKIANLPRGKHANDDPPFGGSCNGRASRLSARQAAATLNVGVRSVERARVVLKDPKLAKAVEAGETTVVTAEKEIKAATGEKRAHNSNAPTDITRDATGYAIPPHLIPLWNRAGEVFEIQKIIARAKHLVKAAHADEEDRLWSGASMQGIAHQLHSAQRDLDGAIPYAVCATCQGHSRDECLHCKGKGFLSKHLFDRTVPEELKAIRAKSCVVFVVTP
jgi:hypothetical protein